MSKLVKRNHMATADSPEVRVYAPDDLRKDLGILGQIKVRMKEREVKSRTAISLTELAGEATRDVGALGIQMKTAELKAAIIARSLPTLAAQNTAMLSLYDQAQLNNAAVFAEGFKEHLTLRHAADMSFRELVDRGIISETELAEAIAITHDRAAEGVARLMRASDSVADALDGLLARATDHIEKLTH